MTSPHSVSRLRHLPGLLALVALALPDPAAAQSYRLIELQPLPGDTTCSAIEMTNDLHAIGTSGGFDAPRYVIWDATGRPTLLPVPPYTRSLRINNHGEIAGTRGLGPPPPFFPKLASWPSVPFRLTDAGAIDLPGPPNASVLAQGLTDTGILLLYQNVSFSFPLGFLWAVYQNQLYQLTADAIAPAGISDAGFFGFNQAGLVPLVQWPGAPPFSPWPEVIPLQQIGPGGHAVGAGWLDGVEQIRYRTPDGLVTPFVSGSTLFAGRLNRTGDLVGRLDSSASSLVFLFRNGQLTDLTHVIPGRPLSNARQITDTGAILVAIESATPNCGAFLIPAALDPPVNLTFTLSGQVVTLQWSASPGAVDYVVEAGSVAGGSDLYRAAVGAALSVSVTAPPGRYYVRVRARAANGESAPSNEILVVVTPP